MTQFLFLSPPCQRQCELLPSLGIRRPLFFHSLILSSETPQLNELKLGRNHVLKVLYKDGSFCPDPLTNMAATGNSCNRNYSTILATLQITLYANRRNSS